jgi:alpha-ribazole phosphatase
MTSRLDLLRHGETERGGGFRGSLDDDLTDLGWEQMDVAVTGRHWDAIVTSPLRRCAAFAEHLAGRSGIPVELVDDLRELHFGDWEGRTAADLMTDSADALGQFWADPYRFTPPGGEPLEQFERRVLSAVRQLAQPSGRQLLVVTHAGVMRLLVAHAQKRPRDLLQIAVAHAQLVGLNVTAAGELIEPKATR